jgi:fatty acid desaturase
MEISDLAVVVFQSLVAAEVVALVIARRSIEQSTIQSLGRRWHQRFDVLTGLVMPALRPAVILVAALLALTVLAISLGAVIPFVAASIAVPLLAGAVTWRAAKDQDWERAARVAARS